MNDELRTITAAVMVIGDEILSGRTKDRNLGYIAEYCTNIGIELREARVVPDIEDEIVADHQHGGGDCARFVVHAGVLPFNS